METNSLADVIKSYIQGHSEGLYTSLPCRITNVSELSTDQVIDVQPVIQKVLTTNEEYTPPVLYTVPVIFPSGGGGILSFPLEVGDTVLVIFSMKSIDDWLNSDGSNVVPFNRRLHDLSDGIAIPGLYPFSKSLSPSSTDVELRKGDASVAIKPDGTLVATRGGSTITMSPTGDVAVSSSGNIVATASGDATVDAGGTLNLVSAGDINITATGAVNVSGASINLN